MSKLKTFMSRFFEGTAFTFLALFVWELLEEALEEVIAMGITTLLTKAISTIFVVSVTQAVKVVIKRFIKAMTYKQGDDKMKVIKNIFTFLWGNKLTTGLVGLSAYAGYLTFEMAFFTMFWANLALAIGIAFLFSIIAVRVGGENLKQIIERLADNKLTKEQKNEAKRKAKELEEKAKKVEEVYLKLQEEEKVKRELELKARAESLVTQQSQNSDNNNVSQ